jgi:hypothetical protein
MEFIDSVRLKAEESQLEEEELGEIPDEFLGSAIYVGCLLSSRSYYVHPDARSGHFACFRHILRSQQYYSPYSFSTERPVQPVATDARATEAQCVSFT